MNEQQYGESKLIGMMIAAEALIGSIKHIMVAENLYEQDLLLHSSLEVTISMAGLCHQRMVKCISMEYSDD
jgi:hypothetical protein